MTSSHDRGAIAGRLVLLLVVVSGIAVLASALALPGAVAADRAVTGVGRSVLDVPPLDIDAISRPAENSLIVAADGTELTELHGPQNRVLVGLNQIPTVTQNAVIATEDSRFWSHRGVNHEAILRAMFANVQSGDIQQGASTITQQYVRNKLLSSFRTDDGGFEVSFDRKLHEALWAVELEKEMSKTDILEGYLNTVYFGDGVYGVGTAAQHYFSKHVSQLTVAESALLAGLVRAPQRNNPRTNPDRALSRRNVVIRQMTANGFITEAEAATATAEPLGLNLAPDADARLPFFVEYVKQVLADEGIELQPEAQAALGETQQDRFDRLFTGGLVIHTTIDPAIQEMAESTITDYLDDPLEDPLASIVSVRPQDGAVVSMAVGPKRFGECPEGQRVCEFTKVIPAVYGVGGSLGQHPGSSFKPIVATAALEEGFTPGWSTETSSGQTIEGCPNAGKTYRVNNYAGGGGGYMDMYEAVKRSNNVYHAKLASAVGPDNVKEIARRLGITHSPDMDQVGCAVGLGGFSVFPMEMASAFATLANRGEHCAPFVVTRIEDRDGNLIYQHEPDCEQVIDRGIADRVTDMIQGPPSPGGTAGFIRGQLGRPVAGKTGTTQDWTDAWFVGYVPQLATAAWVGYEFERCPEDGSTTACGSMFGVEAAGQTYDRVTGGSIPGHMWADYMERALADVPVEGFTTPPPIPSTTVPDVTGMIQEQAIAALEARDFKTVTRVVTHHAPLGEVVGQQPPGGSSAWVGSVVVLEVSDGTGTLQVPDVVGTSEQDAISTLEGMDLDVRIVEQDVEDPDQDGVVVAQSPGAGTEVEPGERVVLAVGRYRSGGGSDGGDSGGDTDDDGGGGNGGGNGRPSPSPSPTES
ncbi:MAG: transglycosylase domain-containing protein [Actinobacteria bacterium]|nr:transglycosylase domain-containing protein [Actinomycetota bacterium]